MSRRTGIIRFSVAAISVFGLLVVGAINFGIATQAQAQHPEISAAEAALRIGITPEALAAAGADAEDTASLFQSLANAESERAVLAAKRAAEEVARAELQALRSHVRSGGMTDARASQLSQLESQLSGATAERDAAESALRAIAADRISAILGGGAMPIIDRMTANSSRNGPIAYRAMDLSAQAWETLERACARQARGAQLTGAESAALNAAMSSQLVATVSTRLNENCDAVAQVFANALTQ